MSQVERDLRRPRPRSRKHPHVSEKVRRGWEATTRARRWRRRRRWQPRRRRPRQQRRQHRRRRQRRQRQRWGCCGREPPRKQRRRHQAARCTISPLPHGALPQAPFGCASAPRFLHRASLAYRSGSGRSAKTRRREGRPLHCIVYTVGCDLRVWNVDARGSRVLCAQQHADLLTRSEKPWPRLFWSCSSPNVLCF